MQLELMGEPRREKVYCAKEVSEQCVAVEWLDRIGVPYYHIPNGGYRNAREGAKFKRMGVKAGVPDFCVCVARRGYYGLYIELKRVKGGSLSDSQKVWRDKLKMEGYAWHEAKGADELIKVVQIYLAG